jgi:hypothetical protein
MKIWSVDLNTDTFSELINVEELPDWTDLETGVTDLAGVSCC